MTDSIGQQLKRAREALNLTIPKVVEGTHIRANQIAALEADEFDSLPSPVQARAYLRLYADFLGISIEAMINNQKNDFSQVGERDLPDLSSTITPIKSAGEAEEPDTQNEDLPTPKEPKPLSLLGYSSRLKAWIKKVKPNPAPIIPHEEFSQPEAQGDLTESENTTEPDSGKEISSPIIEISPSQIIYNTLGRTLRERRESLSLTLDEVERNIHVRTHYLEALETGAFTQLPSSVQARGMLNNYARFLDLDVDALLLTYAEGLQSQFLERQPKTIANGKNSSEPKKDAEVTSKNRGFPANLRRYFSLDAFVGGGLVVLLFIFALWGAGRILNLKAGSTPQPTAPSISDILISTGEAETPSPTGIAGTANIDITQGISETVVITLPPAGNGPVQVTVVSSAQAWLRVTVDGKVQFEGRVNAGAAYAFDGNTQIEVLTGNGRAISILYNQTDMGPMGNTGEVVDRIYTANSILNPTATFTPTPTITPTPTVTRRPTNTLRPSVTPRPSATPFN